MTIDIGKPKKFFQLFIKKVMEDDIGDLAAQIAYYFLLSLFPFLLFIIALLPYFSLNSDAMINLINEYFPGQTSEMVVKNIRSVLEHPSGGLLSFGIIATLWSASNGISSLVRSLNKAYNEKETRTFIKSKLLAIALTIAMVFVIVITLLLPVFGQVILNTIKTYFYVPELSPTVFQFLRWGIASGIMVIVLTVLYQIAPCKKLKFREVFWGAITATVLWQLISLGFSFYVTNFGNFSATYGSLGGVIILMIWFFMTGLILVAGGEINAALSELKKNR
jgi:membrane protein